MPLHIGLADYEGTTNLETKSEYSNRATEVPRSTKATVGHLGNVGDEGLALSFLHSHTNTFSKKLVLYSINGELWWSPGSLLCRMS